MELQVVTYFSFSRWIQIPERTGHIRTGISGKARATDTGGSAPAPTRWSAGPICPRAVGFSRRALPPAPSHPAERPRVI